MERLTYLLDTNAVTDYINGLGSTKERLKQALRDGDTLILCQPVQYEVTRGLLKTGSVRKQQIFEKEFAPWLIRIPLLDADWDQAARFWATATARGRQFSDMDLLIAAVAARLGGVIVSSDEDFDALPIRRENWRVTPPAE